jgi:hypothetical protein
MMTPRKIVVAGSNGDLGKRIVDALIERGADVVALVRKGKSAESETDLVQIGAQVIAVDTQEPDEIAAACQGAECVVSALAGLRESLINAQSILLAGAVKAGVPRFIPSDFCTDFRTLTPGENRNFDLRREFHAHLDVAAIAATSIFNGAFAEVLQYNIPLLDNQARTVSYWGRPDWKVDFTSMDDTAAFTAEAALDNAAPRALCIAGFQMSASDIASFTEEVLHEKYELIRRGSIEELRLSNLRDRELYPQGEKELYSGWQQRQYLHSMLSAHHARLDNDRYGVRDWTSLRDLIK